MSNKNIQLIVFLGALSIVGILSAQIYWIVKTYDLQEEEFQHSVELALIKVAESIEIYNGSVLPTKDLISQRASNYYVVNINDVIDANNLEFYLQEEFERSALNMDFEYGIYDCASDRMVYGDYMSSDEEKTDKPRTELPKYDEYTYYFGVRFPDVTANIISNMSLVIIFTIILLFAISFFVYAMSVILKQKRLSEMQKDFINNMTHEFKTPLSSISISADVFLKNEYVKKNARMHKYAHLIKEQSNRLANEVEKVLQIVKVENDSFRLNKENMNLSELVRKLAHRYEIKLENGKGALSLIMPETAVWINADPMHTANIIENILDNAMKYAGVNDLKLGISGVLKGKELELTITDNGKGIPAEYHQRIFDKFFRVPTGDVHNVKGFGLGLFYVQNICTQHSWNIQMQSIHNKGISFTIIIPTRRPKNSDKS